MKLIKKIICLTIILSFLMPIVVFADMTPPAEQTLKEIVGEALGGFTYGLTHSSSTPLDAKKCGEDALCFSGAGVYVNLVKYDYETKKEEYVGVPVLFYSGGFLNEAHMSLNDPEELYPDTPKGWQGQGHPQWLYTLSTGTGGWYSNSTCTALINYNYKSENVASYPRNKITFYPRGTSGGAFYENAANKNQRIKLIKRNISSDASGYAVFVNNLMGEYKDDGKNSKTIRDLANLFDYPELVTNEKNLKELEKYYIVFDTAIRQPQKATADANSKTCQGNNCKTTSKLLKEWDNGTTPAADYKCSLNGYIANSCTLDSVKGYKCTGTQTEGGSYTHSQEYYCFSGEWKDEVTYNTTYCNEDKIAIVCESKNPPNVDYTKYNNFGYTSNCSQYARWKCGTTTGKYGFTTKAKCEESDGCSGETCTSYTRYDKTQTTCRIEAGRWSRATDYCNGYNISFKAYLYTNTYTYGSSIKRGRDTAVLKMYQALYEGISTGTANEVYQSDGVTPKVDANGNQVYDYYVGPSAKTAIAGLGSTNKYKLWTQDVSSISVAAGQSHKYTLGLAFFWVRHVNSCPIVCENKTGNELLRCAENFCDNFIGYQDGWPVTAQKKDCMINKCHVNYQPNNCSNLPSTPEAQEYKNALSKVKNSSDTTNIKCDEKTCEPYVEEEIEDIQNSAPRNATCYSDPENTPVDQRTFANVACIEYNEVEFENLAYKKIVPGTGVNYDVKVASSKKCYVWFDMDSWQFAYSIYHSKEKICVQENSAGECIKESTPRKLLIQVLGKYNAAKENGYVGEISPSISSLIDAADAETNIQWESTNYSLVDSKGQSRTTVTADVTETLSDKKIKDVKVDLIEESKKEPSSTQSETKNVFSKSVYNRLSTVGSYSSNTYTTTSNVDLEYKMPKYCVSTDGNATITKADEDGKCKQLTVDGRTETVPGQNLYFTSFEALNQSGYGFEIVGKAVIMPSGDDTSYYPEKSSAGNIVCEIEGCKPEPPECSIRITEVGDVVAEDGIYFGMDGIKAEITNIKMNLGGTGDYADEIITYGILIDPTDEELEEYSGKIDAKTLKPSKTGVETHYVYCVAKSKKGQKAVNHVSVTFANCSDSVCKITPNGGSNTKSKYKLTVNVPHKKVSIRAMYGSNETFTIKEYKNVVNSGNYEFTYKNYKKLSLLAIVERGNGNACCVYDISQPPTGDKYNCEVWNAKQDHQYKEVRKYCTTYLADEVHHHETIDDCVNSCMKCTIITECSENAINNVTTYCNQIYGNNTNESRQCINRCYKPICSGGDEYLYRSINNYNPFPNSYDSEAPFDKGKREVGANWVGFTDYIKHDDDDTTSITGVNSNQKPEYVIDLGPGDIEKIRKDTKSKKENDKKEAYTEFTTSTSLEKDYSGEYISSFIHDSNVEFGCFASLFSNPEEYKK